MKPSLFRALKSFALPALAISCAPALAAPPARGHCAPRYSQDGPFEPDCARDPRLLESNDVALNALVFDHSERNDPWESTFGPPGSDPKYRLGFNWGGVARYSRSEDQLFLPASTMKLWTAWAALDSLGKDFRFESSLKWQTNPESPSIAWNLTLESDGDPTWGMSEFGETQPEDHFRKFAIALKHAGISIVDGDIQISPIDHRWETIRFPEGWREEDRVSCYGAQPQFINVGGNCAELLISGPGQIQFVRNDIPVLVVDQLQWGTKTQVRIEPINTEEVESNGFRVTGTWKKRSNPIREWLPIHSVAQWSKSLMIQALQEQGIELRKENSRTPAQLETNSLTFFSPPLEEILVPFLKKSLNWIGETLLRKLGQEESSEPQNDLTNLGQRHLNRRVKILLGSDPAFEGVIYQDGSGVSHQSFTTPHASSRLLEAIRLHPQFAVFWNALPIAGVDGTLEGRMQSSAAAGWLRAKTGTLSDAYNLAGFVPSSSWNGTAIPKPDEVLPFVTLIHTQRESSKEARALIDRVGVRLSELQRAD